MLNRDELITRLERGDIFKTGTWDEKCVGSASYDLRIAEDFLIMPDAKRNQVGEKVNNLVLAPGNVALVSTEEKFCLTWDLVGNMSPKFSKAKEGILVHTGSIIDPGFGFRKTEGGWEPREDERVHFIIANLSRDSVYLRPKDKIATVQFNKIVEPSVKTESSSRAKVENELFKDEKTPLSLNYFANMKSITGELEKKLDEVEQQQENTSKQLDLVEKGYKNLTFFGIYVLAAALLTIFGSLVLRDGVADIVISGNANNWFTLILVLTLLGILLVPILFTFYLFRDHGTS